MATKPRRKPAAAAAALTDQTDTQPTPDAPPVDTADTTATPPRDAPADGEQAPAAASTAPDSTLGDSAVDSPTDASAEARSASQTLPGAGIEPSSVLTEPAGTVPNGTNPVPVGDTDGVPQVNIPQASPDGGVDYQATVPAPELSDLPAADADTAAIGDPLVYPADPVPAGRDTPDPQPPTVDEQQASAAPTPSAAPVDPPPMPAPSPDQVAAPSLIQVNPHEAGVLMALNSLGTRLLDAGAGLERGTDETPDPDTLFERTTEHGSSWVCTRRVEQISLQRPFMTQQRQLVLGEGAVVDTTYVDQIRGLLREQLDAEAARAAGEDVPLQPNAGSGPVLPGSSSI